MMKDYRYLVFRVYTKEERYDPEDRCVFFGWSRNKHVIDCFKRQRNMKKYRITKLSDDEINYKYSEDILDNETMIDYIKLHSALNGKIVTFFSTSREIHDAEINIQRYFSELSSIANIKGDADYLSMIHNLKPMYGEALYFIGYRPKEFDILFQPVDSSNAYSSIELIENYIDDVYEGALSYPTEHDSSGMDLNSVSILEDVYSKILYSLENFIRVLKDDL